VSYTPRYDKGNWKADCDVCGRTYKASELQKRWDGLMCCRHDWEIRQPQDFVRGVADTQIAPWTRPEPTDQFVPIAYWYTVTANAIRSTVTLVTKKIPGKVLTILSTSISTITTLFYPKSNREVNGSSINSKTIG
jgi:hypothetical protein